MFLALNIQVQLSRRIGKAASLGRCIRVDNLWSPPVREEYFEIFIDKIPMRPLWIPLTDFHCLVRIAKILLQE